MGNVSTHGFSSKILAVVLAGGRGSRLHDLTDELPKPALPVGQHGRLIDFTLTNVVNSGIRDALVLTQYKAAPLARYLGRHWTPGHADRALSLGIIDGSTHGTFRGTADAVAKVIAEVDCEAPDHVVILAGDHLYQMDYRPFVARHISEGADVTVGAVHVPLADAHEFGVMALGARGRIIAFTEKPASPPQTADKPGFALASMGIYVFDWATLRAMLLNLTDHEELDFGRHLLPRLVERGRAFSYALPGRGQAEPFWQDLGTLDAFHSIHAAFARGVVRLDPSWPLPQSILSKAVDGAVWLDDVNALKNVVLLPGARIGREVVLQDAIVTGDAVVPDGFDLSRALAVDGQWCRISDGGIHVISARAMRRLAELSTVRPVSAKPRFNDNAPELSWVPQFMPSRRVQTGR